MELANSLAYGITSLRTQDALMQQEAISGDILASLPGIFYMYDEGCSLVRWNKQHEEALGYSAQELAHKHVLDFFEGEDRARIASAVDQIFATGQADAEARILTGSGESLPYFFTGLRTTLGGKLYFVGLGVDISERVRAEEGLRRYAERLQMLHESTRASCPPARRRPSPRPPWPTCGT
jgi:PAS domain S-box-containing protein